MKRHTEEKTKQWYPLKLQFLEDSDGKTPSQKRRQGSHAVYSQQRE